MGGGRKLIGGDQRRGVEQQVQVAFEFVDLFLAGQQKGFHVTAPPAERDIVFVRVGEGRGAFHVEGNFTLAKIAPKGQLHPDPADDAPHALDVGAAHAVVGVRQGTAGIGDAALAEIGGVGDADEVVFCEHKVWIV